MTVYFHDPDVGENHLGKMTTEMTAAETVAYTKFMIKQTTGLQVYIAGSAARERAIFTKLAKDYGKVNAGKIVKYAFYSRAEEVGFTSFDKARRWWTDKIFESLQRCEVFEREQVEAQAAGRRTGMMTGADFLAALNGE